MSDFRKSSFFLPKTKVETYSADSRQSKSLRCPHCQKLGTFYPYVDKYLSFKNLNQDGSQVIGFCSAFTLRCPNNDCNGIVFSIFKQALSGEESYISFPPEMIDFDTDGIPDQLVKTINEALICHSNGAYRASAMMVRRLLEELCAECGAEGTNLFQRLKELRKKITLPEELFESMDELKALGNDAAHIEAKEYLSIDAEESETSIMLAREILKARYQHKLLLDRLRKLKK